MGDNIADIGEFKTDPEKERGDQVNEQCKEH